MQRSRTPGWRTVLVMWAAMIAGPAAAWDGVVTVKILQIEATDGGNYGFRIWGGIAMCGDGSLGWAYMEPTWNNYQATAALITSAWLANRAVTFYSNKDANGYCRFSHVTVR